MLRIQPEIVAEVENASSADDLHVHLQAAVQLEHATIPPYLTALFSLKPGANSAAKAVLASVVVEEMLHLTIAANLLNALGGSPVLDTPGFIPVYPGPLPMGVRGGLVVGLEKLTRGLVYNTFMGIEEPEAPLDIPVTESSPFMAGFAAAAPRPSYATIGAFYAAISATIGQLGDGAFTGDPARQVVDPTWFPPDQLFAIRDVASAQRAIAVIVEQGEGTSTSPVDAGEPAHFYRFGQLVYARMLVPDPTQPIGWSYGGPAVGIDPAGVWNLLPNAKTADYAEGSKARFVADRFNAIYTNLLRSLEAVFNGAPGTLKSALGLMAELHVAASALVSLPLPGTDFTAAPTFEYAPA